MLFSCFSVEFKSATTALIDFCSLAQSTLFHWDFYFQFQASFVNLISINSYRARMLYFPYFYVVSIRGFTTKGGSFALFQSMLRS